MSRLAHRHDAEELRLQVLHLLLTLLFLRLFLFLLLNVFRQDALKDAELLSVELLVHVRVEAKFDVH